MPLSAFTPQVREWFTRAFAEPTAAQAQAWPAIATGEHTLISAPTGSGKTLAAFLWGLDRLVAEPSTDRTRIVYVSPLKALSYDVEKNLRAPLRGIGADADVGVRKPLDLKIHVPVERERHVRAALGLRDRVDLVHDHPLGALEDLARLTRTAR